MIYQHCPSMCEFQSTRPRGARHVPIICAHLTSEVSIHAPAGGATSAQSSGQMLRFRFNPRARGGRDGSRGHYRLELLLVSIHAPAGGATKDLLRHPWEYSVSIHAPAGGATAFRRRFRRRNTFQSTRPRGARLRPGADVGNVIYRFNPRARGGRDQRCQPGKRAIFSFNPRARGGRDLLFSSKNSFISGFNPRARGGRDTDKLMCLGFFISFNPRARGGRDSAEFPQCTQTQRFNPRARGGRDLGGIGRNGLFGVSIHAPAGGATTNGDIIIKQGYVSIHAPAGGAT